MEAMKLYGELAPWWPLVSTPSDYAHEASMYRGLIGPMRRVLELGSGGGNNASHLKQWFEMTLVELSEGMLGVSRGLNPECEHHQGDMRTVRLGRTFDAVFVHDAICYMTTERDLGAALATVGAHLAPGGRCVIAPDATREIFTTSTHEGGHDDPRTGRGVRYLMWTLPAAAGATTYAVHFAFLLRDADGSVRAVHDEHTEGLFPRATWLRLLDEHGFDAALHPLTHEEGMTTEAFVGVKR
jgi:SAM-dependent methyltransferase